MNKEEMRIAIAEKCGWKDITKDLQNNLLGRIPNCIDWGIVPNYPEDLNACHEMEKVIAPDYDRWANYLGWLWKITNPDCDFKTDRTVHIQNYITWKFKRATAEQCCEAFCRVFWPERFDN